jgi:hypothetical protein
LSLDKLFVFCGGNTKPRNDRKPSAIVAAMRFDRELEVVDQIELTERDPTVAFCIKQSTRENIVFVGCMKCIYVLEWTNLKLKLLSIAVDIHSSKPR